MLLTRLQSQAVSRAIVGVYRDTDDASGDGTLILVLRGKITCRRTAVEHRNTEALAATEHNVRTPFARRRQQHKAHQVSCHSHAHILGTRLLYERTIVLDLAVSVRILHDGGEYLVGKLKRLEVARYHFDALRLHARTDHSLRRLKHVLIYEERVRPSLGLSATARTVKHRSGLSSCRRLVQQRAVGQRQSRQLADHGLEIQQSLQTTLRDLGLIRRVRSVPCGILEHVALDRCRAHGVIPSHTDVGGEYPVLARQFGDMLRKLALGHRGGQIQRFLQADVRGDRLFDQLIQRVYPDSFQHCSFVFIGRNADVTVGKFVRIHCLLIV